jgi:hypothetical protein
VVPEPLDTVIPTCLASLVASVEHAVAHAGLEDVRVVVADDRSEPAGRERIERVFARLSVPWEIATPEVTKAGPVMHSQFAAGAGQDRLVYFCEDDYLHVPEAVTAMVAFYRQVHGATGGHLMLHPQEQRSLYVRHYPSYLLMGADRHWRTTSDMSHTLFTHGKAVEAYWSYFENTKYMGHPRARVRHKGSERRTTNRLLGVIPGFCPIPALAAHFQEERLLPPYFQWRELYAANRVD